MSFVNIRDIQYSTVQVPDTQDRSPYSCIIKPAGTLQRATSTQGPVGLGRLPSHIKIMKPNLIGWL